jgi:hypothetical protein
VKTPPRWAAPSCAASRSRTATEVNPAIEEGNTGTTRRLRAQQSRSAAAGQWSASVATIETDRWRPVAAHSECSNGCSASLSRDGWAGVLPNREPEERAARAAVELGGQFPALRRRELCPLFCRRSMLPAAVARRRLCPDFAPASHRVTRVSGIPPTRLERARADALPGMASRYLIGVDVFALGERHLSSRALRVAPLALRAHVPYRHDRTHDAPESRRIPTFQRFDRPLDPGHKNYGDRSLSRVLRKQLFENLPGL